MICSPGQGGLGEGFSSIVDGRRDPRFDVKVSVAIDKIAHETLSLRALFRAFRKGAVLDCYYDYVRGDITRAELFAHRSIPEETRVAAVDQRVKNLRDWGIPLGRRLRALRQWYLIREQGVERLRRDLENARWLEQQVRATPRCERRCARRPKQSSRTSPIRGIGFRAGSRLVAC